MRSKNTSSELWDDSIISDQRAAEIRWEKIRGSILFLIVLIIIFGLAIWKLIEIVISIIGKLI